MGQWWEKFRTGWLQTRWIAGTRVIKMKSALTSATVRNGRTVLSAQNAASQPLETAPSTHPGNIESLQAESRAQPLLGIRACSPSSTTVRRTPHARKFIPTRRGVQLEWIWKG